MKRFTLLVILGCNSVAYLLKGGTEPKVPSALLEIACEFETTTTTGASDQGLRTRIWRLWRNSNEVEAREVGGKDSEVWERNARGKVTCYRVFHPEKRVIEYDSAALTPMRNQPEWDRISCIMSPQFINGMLKKTGSENVLNRQATRYEGENNGVRYELLWLEPERIPALLREAKGDKVVTTTLKAAYSLAQSPWPHGEWGAYQVLDCGYNGGGNGLGMRCAVGAHLSPSYYPSLAR
ncbi:hypothetical protein ACXR0O_13165 [Verrucomicrobiota bacterium sgz303538]